jgi:hypothetical protein
MQPQRQTQLKPNAANDASTKADAAEANAIAAAAADATIKADSWNRAIAAAADDATTKADAAQSNAIAAAADDATNKSRCRSLKQMRQMTQQKADAAEANAGSSK